MKYIYNESDTNSSTFPMLNFSFENNCVCSLDNPPMPRSQSCEVLKRNFKFDGIQDSKGFRTFLVDVGMPV